MKKLFLLTFLLFCSIIGSLSAHERPDGHQSHDAYEHEARHRHSPYFISDNSVFFEGYELKGASASSYYYGTTIN